MNKFLLLLQKLFKSVWSYRGLTIYLELSALVLFVLSFKNGISDVFNVLPATGGDTGSHFWPLVVLREYGFPNFNLRVWNPGNFAGEPLLVHYFPLPFIFMALLSYLIPSGLAFNLITFVPGLFLAPAMWWSARTLARGLGASAEIARVSGAIAAITSFGVFFNNGHSMWGGNIFSLLSGQFAHQWAFLFFILWIGALPKAVAFGGKSLLFSALMLAFVVMSHGYVAIMMPIALLGIICVPSPSLKDRFVRGLMMGVLGSTLSVWFWWPLIDNSKWTTPYGLSWVFDNFFKEAIPIEIAPSILLTTVLFIIFMFLPKYFLTSTRFLFFWSGQLIIGIACIPILASLGVVNVRTIPHVQYVLCYLAASLLATALFREGLKSWLSRCALLTALLLPFIQWHVIKTSVNLSTGWINWNYTGWTVKDSYDSVQKISERLKGNFSDPRVVFEHDGAFNGAGTPRVFEMLPYFASRSTTDGLYMQSTILAPHMFYNQATVSETPSCPFLEFGCAPKSFDLAVNYAPLLAVDTFILSAESTKEAARGRSDLEFLLSAPPWEVFKLRDENIRYIETLRIPPKSVSDKVWRTSFWEWFKAYQPSDPFLLRETPSKDWQVATLAASVDPEGRCAPKAEVNFNRILVTTDCPGKTHVLKFAYHDSWRSSGGEDLVLLSPGYIGIVPKSSKLELTFGQSFSWILSSYVSLCAWLIFFLGCLLQIAAIRRKMVPILVFLRISEN